MTIEISKAQQLILVTGMCIASIGLGLLASDTEWVFKLGAILLTGSFMFMMIGCIAAE